MDALISLAREVAARMGAATSIGDCARRLVVVSLGAIAVGVLTIASVGAPSLLSGSFASVDLVR
jgi:hypothetical protein